MNRAFAGLFEKAGVGEGNSGYQNTLLVLKQLRRDVDDLRGGLAGAENDFRKALAQGPVRIDLGEAEIGYRRGLELSQHIVPADTTGAEFLQQFDSFRRGHGLIMS